MSLADMIKRVESEPKPQLIYSGIKENSVGIVFGPSKSGKTMYCENLAMSIAANAVEYLGLPIEIENRKILIISFEERYTNRTLRNASQIKELVITYGDKWVEENYIVANEHMPTYVESDEDWRLLREIITKHAPGIVFFDSFTRMCPKIEESESAKEFTKRLRHLSTETNTTIIGIHHTHKMYGQPISMDTIAGSRVIAQEMDFAIGINRTPDGKRYIKDVMFRYAPDNSETVRTFTIDENCWLNITGEAYEVELLVPLDGKKYDGRQNDNNTVKLLEYFTEQITMDKQEVATSELEELISTGKMSRATLYTQLNKLVNTNKIIKAVHGKYKLADKI